MLQNEQITTILLIINSLGLIVIYLAMFKAITTYKNLTKDIDKKDIGNVLNSLKNHTKSLDKDLLKVKSDILTTKSDIKSHIQKIGFVRYNPFGDTGGDQSFCLSLLDKEDSGILITSLHARDHTRIYTKQIKKGHPLDNSELSREESQSLKNAKKWSKQ